MSLSQNFDYRTPRVLFSCDKTKLINELTQTLQQGFIRGSSYETMAKELSSRMDSEVKRCRTIVNTESAYFSQMAQADCYRDLGVKEYEVLVTLDDTTCDECGAYDGEHLPMAEYVEGVTAPPFHPNCRCTTIPYFDDEFTVDEQRVMRNQDGKSVLVDDLSYGEYRDRYLSGDAFSFLSVSDAVSSGKIIEGEPPKLFGKINPKQIDEAVTFYGDQMRNLKKEHVIIIQPNGSCYGAKGTASSVNAGGVNLKGAYVIHNHPISQGIKSFGKDDFIFLRNHQDMAMFEAVNEKYNYVTKVLKDMSKVTYDQFYGKIEKPIEEIAESGIDLQHEAFEELRKKGYVYYRRIEV